MLLSVAGLAAFLCRRFLDPDSPFHVLDRPGARSLHHQAVPRSGGVALVTALLLGWGIGWWGNLIPWSSVSGRIALGVVFLALVGALDDRRGLSPLARLPVQLVAALLLVDLAPTALDLPGLEWRWSRPVAVGFTLLFVLWMTNLYNFMDGLDGLAGSMALVGFSTLAVLGWLGGAQAFAWSAALVAAAAVGFLYFNRPPARLFMGDAGAPVLGYLAAAFVLWGEALGAFPLWVGLLVFAPFVVDATYTLMRRALGGEAVWRAHRSHLYQRLALAWGGHGRVLAWGWLVMGLCSLAAVAAVVWPQARGAIFWGALLAWGGLVLFTEHHLRGRA